MGSQCDGVLRSVSPAEQLGAAMDVPGHRAGATEPDLLPAWCQAAALREEAGSLWVQGQQELLL